MRLIHTQGSSPLTIELAVERSCKKRDTLLIHHEILDLASLGIERKEERFQESSYEALVIMLTSALNHLACVDGMVQTVDENVQVDGESV